MIEYISLCLISIIAGKGIFNLFRIPLKLSLSIFLAPIVTMSFWSLFLGWGVALGYPVKNLWQLGWILTFLFLTAGIYGTIREFHTTKILFFEFQMLLMILLLPMLVMFPFFIYGITSYVGSPASDGWAYIAYGQYLWEHIRGTEGQLIPLHQFASTITHSRFISPAILGFFSPVFNQPGDTQSAANLFVAWCLFNCASSCVFFILNQKLTKTLKFYYLLFVIFSTWIIGLLSANNFDNALILSFLPAVAGIGNFIKENKFKWALLLGFFMAAVFYCYPEGSPILFFGAFISLIIPILINQHDKIKKYIFPIISLLIASFLLISPFVFDGINFLLQQINLAHGSIFRPGEGCFPALIDHAKLAAFWGLINTSVYGGKNITILGIDNLIVFNLLSLILSFLTIMGLIILWKEKQRGLVLLCILFNLGYAEMIFHQHYSYGAYKLLLLNWWLLVFCVIKAVNNLLNITFKFKRILQLILCLTGISYVSASFSMLHYFDQHIVKIKDITPYKKLTSISKLIGNKAIQVSVDDSLASEWAVYFLREYPIKLTLYRSYMASPGTLPYMKNSKLIKTNDIDFLLIDSFFSLPSKNLIWSSGPYFLWKMQKEWVYVTNLENQNGIENINGKTWIWLGKGETRFHLLSNIKGHAIFTGQFNKGPSLSNSVDRQLLVKVGKEFHKIIKITHDGKYSFIFPIAKDSNEIQLFALDKPSISILPNGDNRPLLIGLTDFKVKVIQHQT